MIVTISNQYGCGAVAAAKRAAELLGYTLVDSELPVVVEKGRSLGERWLAGLESSTPELANAGPPPSEAEVLMRAVEDAVRAYAARGNAVIVGRGASAILGRRDDVLRVFVHAPRDWRVERVMDELQMDRRPAMAEVDRIDKMRHAFMRDWHGVEFGSSDMYDLAIDAARFGIESTAQLIVAAVTARS